MGKDKENVAGKAHTNTPTHLIIRKKKLYGWKQRVALDLMKGERGEGDDALEGRRGRDGLKGRGGGGTRVFHQKDAAELSE